MNMLNPIDVAKELRFSLSDRDDPPLNDIYALERLIEIATLSKEYADKAGITTSPIAKLLVPFCDQYAMREEVVKARLSEYENEEIVHVREQTPFRDCWMSSCAGFIYRHAIPSSNDISNVIWAFSRSENDVVSKGIFNFLEQALTLLDVYGGELSYNGVLVERTEATPFPLTVESMLRFRGRAHTIHRILMS